MFHFSSWLRKNYPGLFGTRKTNRKSIVGPSGGNRARGRSAVFFRPRLQGLEDRVTPAGLPTVAILGADTTAFVNDVQTKLVNTGQFAQVDVLNVLSSTPTLGTLDNYAAVLVWSDYVYSDATTLGNNLAAYVDQGHGVVEATFNWSTFFSDDTLLGNWVSGGYESMTDAGHGSGSFLTLGPVEQPSHPVMQGVTNFNGGADSFYIAGSLTANTNPIAEWSNDAPLAFEHTGKNGRIIGLNFFPPSDTVVSGFWESNTQGALLMANSLTYASGITIGTTVDLTNGVLSVTDPINNIQNGLTLSEVTNPIGLPAGNYVQAYDPNNALTATGGALQVDTNTVDAPLSGAGEVTSIDVGGKNGLDGGDTLTLDYSGGNFANDTGNPVPINFNGGPGSNSLSLVNGFFNTAAYTYTDNTSGSASLDGQTITFSNTASITDADTNTNDVFNLPAGATASLSPDANFGNADITGSNKTVVPTTFVDPQTGDTLTVSTGGQSSVVQLNLMDGGFAPSMETFSGLAGDVFQFLDPAAVPITTSVTLTTATLDLNGLSPTFDALDGDGLITDSRLLTTSTLTIDANGGTGSFSGVIQDGSGTVALTLDATGALETLSGANTYSGLTTITLGTLQVGANNSIPASSDVIDSDTFDLNGFIDTVGALAGAGLVTSSVAGSAMLTVGATGNSATFTGVIADGANGTGIVSFGKTGSGVETLTATNSYSGGTTISAGTLSISKDRNLGSVPGFTFAADIVFAGGTLEFTNAVALVLNARRGMTFDTGGTVMIANAAITYGGPMFGGGGLTKDGPGDLTLNNNTALNAPGPVTISAGRLFFTSLDAIGTSLITVDGTTTLDYLGGLTLTLPNPMTLLNDADVATRNAQLTLSPLTVLPVQGLILFNDDNVPTKPLIVQGGTVLTGTLIVQVGGGNPTVGTTTISGVISGVGGLTKTQIGTLILANSGNTYDLDTTINQGILQLGAINAVPSGHDAGDVHVAAGALLDVAGFNTTVNGLFGAGTVDNLEGGNETLSVGGNNINSAFAGAIQNTKGVLSLAKIGAGTLTLIGTTTYGGSTTISAGTLQLGKTNAIPATSDVTDNAIFDLGGFSDVVGALTDLSGNGIVTSSAAGTATLTVGGTGRSGTFSGAIHDGSGGTVALAKLGAGTETITGLTNTNTGTTTVSAGTLEIDGDLLANVSISGTGTLAGTGTLGGTVSGAAGADSPGKPLGTLTTSALTLLPGAAFNGIIGGNTTGNYGQDNVTSGTITIAGATLNLSDTGGYVPLIADTYVLLNNTTGSPINGTFVAGNLGAGGVAPGTALPEGAVVSSNFLGTGLPATITYKGGANHQSVAIVVNPDITVSIGNPSVSITNGGPVVYTVSYFDFGGDFASSNLSTANVHLITTGTATGTLSFDGSSGSTRLVTVRNISGQGSLAIAIDAGSGVDTSGNAALASGTSCLVHRLQHGRRV